MGTINQGIGSNAGDILNMINQYATTDTGQQRTINQQAIQNELSKQQGMQGVLDMVHNGIQSGGVTIGNAGGGTSSASEALARAYGLLGRQDASKVGNQYAQGQNTIQNTQQNLNDVIGQQGRDVTTSKADRITTIVTGAQAALQQLNYMAQIASAPDRVDIEKQINDVKAQALQELSQYDRNLSDSVTANGPTSQEANQASARGLATTGTAAAQPFNFTSNVPQNLQGTGDFSSSLPIFVSPNNKNNQAPALA